jgi:hypothetical protein
MIVREGCRQLRFGGLVYIELFGLAYCGVDGRLYQRV